MRWTRSGFLAVLSALALSPTRAAATNRARDLSLLRRQLFVAVAHRNVSISQLRVVADLCARSVARRTFKIRRPLSGDGAAAHYLTRHKPIRQPVHYHMSPVRLKDGPSDDDISLFKALYNVAVNGDASVLTPRQMLQTFGTTLTGTGIVVSLVAPPVGAALSIAGLAALEVSKDFPIDPDQYQIATGTALWLASDQADSNEGLMDALKSNLPEIPWNDDLPTLLSKLPAPTINAAAPAVDAAEAGDDQSVEGVTSDLSRCFSDSLDQMRGSLDRYSDPYQASVKQGQSIDPANEQKDALQRQMSEFSAGIGIAGTLLIWTGDSKAAQVVMTVGTAAVQGYQVVSLFIQDLVGPFALANTILQGIQAINGLFQTPVNQTEIILEATNHLSFQISTLQTLMQDGFQAMDDRLVSILDQLGQLVVQLTELKYLDSDQFSATRNSIDDFRQYAESQKRNDEWAGFASTVSGLKNTLSPHSQAQPKQFWDSLSELVLYASARAKTVFAIDPQTVQTAASAKDSLLAIDRAEFAISVLPHLCGTSSSSTAPNFVEWSRAVNAYCEGLLTGAPTYGPPPTIKDDLAQLYCDGALARDCLGKILCTEGTIDSLRKMYLAQAKAVADTAAGAISEALSQLPHYELKPIQQGMQSSPDVVFNGASNGDDGAIFNFPLPDLLKNGDVVQTFLPVDANYRDRQSYVLTDSKSGRILADYQFAQSARPNTYVFWAIPFGANPPAYDIKGGLDALENLRLTRVQFPGIIEPQMSTLVRAKLQEESGLTDNFTIAGKTLQIAAVFGRWVTTLSTFNPWLRNPLDIDVLQQGADVRWNGMLQNVPMICTVNDLLLFIDSLAKGHKVAPFPLTLNYGAGLKVLLLERFESDAKKAAAYAYVPSEAFHFRIIDQTLMRLAIVAKLYGVILGSC